MGCDIHLIVEAKTYAGWHSIHHPHIDRWYALFSLMAGVRSYDDSPPPISQPRGLPSDVSDIARIILAGDDNQSLSWLSSEEWERVCATMGKDAVRSDLSDVVPYEVAGDYRDKRILDYRVVFAFDN